MESLWERREWYGGAGALTKSPAEYLPGRVYGCVFDDVHGLQSRDVIGMGQIMFETDFPHTDSTYPNSAAVAEKLATRANLDERETYQLVRGNAIECYQLQRYGITE